MSATDDIIVSPVAAAPAAAAKRRDDTWLWLVNPRLAIGFTIIAIFGLGSFILPFFAPADPSLQATYLKNMPMSAEHLLGTNALGQDIFWFLVVAIRNSLTLGIMVGVGVSIVSTIVGLSAGYIGGNFERAVMLVVDTFITIPLLPILIILGAETQRSVHGLASLTRSISAPQAANFSSSRS